MVICPVCEFSQAQGTSCDQCGKVFAQAPVVAAPPAARLPELEQTAYADVPTAAGVERLPELEATAFKAAGVPAAEVIPDLENTRTAPVQAVASAPIPELDLGRAVSDGIKTAAPGASITCRYCRTVQTGGVMCERCGMRLPRLAAKAAVAATQPREVVWTRCRKCGGRAKEAMNCPSCGDPVPASGA